MNLTQSQPPMHSLKYRILEMLMPEMRTAAIDFLSSSCPTFVKRISENLADIPVPKCVRYPDEKPLFIHIPKNAGTNVATQLYGRHVGHRTAMWYRNADRRMFERKTSFAICRDPLARFFSAYEFITKGGSEEVKVSRRARAIVMRCESIREFVTDFSKRPVSELEKIDPVFHMQCSYVLDNLGSTIVDQIFRLEQVTGTTIEVEGTTIDLSMQANVSKSAAKVTPEDYELISKSIRKIYAKDYEFFGYP